MPLYMDRHDVSGATAEDTARNHAADLENAAKYGVEFFSYWFDPDAQSVFCLARAPDADAVVHVHEVSHGQVPGEIMEVSESDVVRFLGKVHDPADASEVTSAFRVIGFTDLVGSTELLEQLGQSEFMVLLSEHDLIVRKALLAWQGREVKHTGDGFMVVFEDVDKALWWSLDVREAFEAHPDLDIRQGIAAGEPVDHDDDLFGAAVNLANRICAAAGPQHVFVSDAVHDLAVEFGFHFGERQSLPLKGFSEPQTVYELLVRR